MTIFLTGPNSKHLQTNVAKIVIYLFDRVENIMEKGENAGYQHFLLFPGCFLNVSSLGSLKVRTVW